MMSGFFDLPERFAIFGAQVIAYGAYKAIEHLYDRTPLCFIVSSTEGNPEIIENIPVVTPESVPRDITVIPAVTALLQDEVRQYLTKMGFGNVLPFTQEYEHKLMSDYFGSIGKFPAAPQTADSGVSSDRDIVMYEVRNRRDKPLSAPPVLKEFEKTIQAGAASGYDCGTCFRDDTGCNISGKNHMYCEMSAVYWVWKNQSHDWMGIEHYRRHLIVSREMLVSGADALLPLPYVCFPNAMAQLKRFINDNVADLMLKALKSLHPEEYESYLDIIYGSYQYTYNLLCLKKHIFDDYCKWFFEITEYMESASDAVPEIKTTRALSYVAEALTNIYFMHNKNNIRILHCEKNIYI